MQRTLADAFTEKTGIEVEYLSLSSDTSEYKDKLAMMLNAQTYLDCAFMMDGAQMPPLMERGQIEPITDLVARDIDKEHRKNAFRRFLLVVRAFDIYGAITGKGHMLAVIAQYSSPAAQIGGQGLEDGGLHLAG